MHAKYLGSKRIIAFIENEQLEEKILKHLDLWDVKRKPSPRANGPPPESVIIYDQSSATSADDYLIDADRSTFGSRQVLDRLSD